MEYCDRGALVRAESWWPMSGACMVLLEELPEGSIPSVHARDVAHSCTKEDASPQSALNPSPQLAVASERADVGR